MMRYSVRIKLTDFINTESEEYIIKYIVGIAEESGKKVFLNLWYRETELTPEDIKAFVLRYESLLETIGTNIHMGDHEHWTQKSWFNIRTSFEKNATEYRHEFIFEGGLMSDLLRGIGEFRNMVLAVLNTSPIAPANTTPPPWHHRSRVEKLDAASEQKQNGYRVVIRKVTKNENKKS